MSPKRMLMVVIASMKPQEGSAAHIKPGCAHLRKWL